MAAPPSLLDDPFFVAELAKLELPLGTLLPVGGFVAMMLMGAAAAVVVFHDRGALILQTLP